MAIIAIDFDGTMVADWFPNVGTTLPGAVETIKELIDNGHKIILYTCRNIHYLEQAVKWVKDNDIELFGINDNPEQEWRSSKLYYDILIDDRAIGVPLSNGSVDWYKVRNLLCERGYL